MSPELGSLITAAVTPFDADGTVNHDAFRAVLRHLVATGSEGVVVTGTTGECPTLTDDEKLALWRTAVDEIGGTAAVIAGTGTYDTSHTVALSRQACELGVDGVLVVTPYYSKPPREGLVHHFTQAARASSVPLIIYNIPGRTGTNLEPDLLAELSALGNIVGVKQSNDDLVQAQEIRSLAPDLALYAGDDSLLLPMLGIGAVGGICVASHVIGRQMADVIRMWHDGDEAASRELSESIEDVYETLSITANPIPVKAALNLMGMEVGGLRLPLVEATGMQVERIRAMLARHELVTTPA
jgi:4-hydroxy-tetrahydrodipicolinate synthase